MPSVPATDALKGPEHSIWAELAAQAPQAWLWFASFILYKLERRAIVPLTAVTPPTPFPKLQHQAEQLPMFLLESGMEIPLRSSPVLTLPTR